MNISTTIGAESLGIPRTPLAIAQEAKRAEEAGFRSAWSTHFSRGVDSLTTLAVAASGTEHIELGVGVVPSYPRHPVALAQAAATVQSIAGGRFVLGVGVSHRPVIETMHGLDAADPIGHMREYLSVLVPLVTTGECSFSGDHYRVEANIVVPGTSSVPVVVGALAPRMCRLGGELADGVTTWLAGPRSLSDVVTPAVAAGAAASGRAGRIIAAIPVAVDDDTERASAAAASVFARYGTLPNYQRLFEREGVGGPAEVAVLGDEQTVSSGLRSLFAAGATDVWAVVFDTGSGTDRTESLLRSLSAE